MLKLQSAAISNSKILDEAESEVLSKTTLKPEKVAHGHIQVSLDNYM